MKDGGMRFNDHWMITDERASYNILEGSRGRDALSPIIRFFPFFFFALEDESEGTNLKSCFYFPIKFHTRLPFSLRAFRLFDFQCPVCLRSLVLAFNFCFSCPRHDITSLLERRRQFVNSYTRHLFREKSCCNVNDFKEKLHEAFHVLPTSYYQHKIMILDRSGKRVSVTSTIQN